MECESLRLIIVIQIRSKTLVDSYDGVFITRHYQLCCFSNWKGGGEMEGTKGQKLFDITINPALCITPPTSQQALSSLLLASPVARCHLMLSTSSTIFDYRYTEKRQ